MLCVTEGRREGGKEGEKRKRGREGVRIAPIFLVMCCTALQLF